MNNNRFSRTLTRAVAVSLGIALVAGCAVRPKPLSPADRKATLVDDKRSMFGNQQAVQGAITLEEAMARALKYNLESRVKLMEAALAQKQLNLASVELLPRLAASAGYSRRDNLLASSSRSVETGLESLEPSTSSDRGITNADLSLSWNILDFGVSYYGAKQQADRLLGLQERRRKVIQLLMQQTREAFWQAAGAQRLQGEIEPLLTQAREALSNSRNVERNNLTAPLEALAYQREMLELVLQLEGLRSQLSQAKPKLAALMNMEPGKPFEVAATSQLDKLSIGIAPDQMEEAALLNRPELIEARYNERIGLLETRRAMARLFPGIELSLGTHYNSNSFLVNETWNDAGVKVGWNLLNLVSAGRIRAAAKAQYDVAREQRLAANMAVLAQVHVAWVDFNSRQQQFDLVNELNGVEQRILQNTRNAAAADARGRLAEIRSATGALMSQLRLYQSYSAYQGAYGQMLATLGVDPVPNMTTDSDIAALVATIRSQQSR